MRDDSVFLEWCIRNKFFLGFNVSETSCPDLRLAFISVFFANNEENYDDFNKDIAYLKNIKPTNKKIISLRIILNNQHAAMIKAAFLISPWKKNVLSAQSIAFEKALKCLKNTQRQVFTIWMAVHYKRFRDSVSAPLFAKSLKMLVCPYCDKAFLDVGKQFYGELDHYLDKSTHSYYALNIYNFVPVCSVCNRKKSKKKLQYFNPTNDNLDSVFQFYLSDKDRQDAVLSYHPVNLRIRQRVLPGKKAHLKELNDTFALDDRYESMTAVVDYLAQLKRIYTPVWMKELRDTYGINYSNEQLRQLLLGQFSFRDPAIRLQPLTKLIDDLVKDLDVFNDSSLPPY